VTGKTTPAAGVPQEASKEKTGKIKRPYSPLPEKLTRAGTILLVVWILLVVIGIVLAVNGVSIHTEGGTFTHTIVNILFGVAACGIPLAGLISLVTGMVMMSLKRQSTKAEEEEESGGTGGAIPAFPPTPRSIAYAGKLKELGKEAGKLTSTATTSAASIKADLEIGAIIQNLNEFAVALEKGSHSESMIAEALRSLYARTYLDDAWLVPVLMMGGMEREAVNEFFKRYKEIMESLAGTVKENEQSGEA
jgi:hypothetical protein